MRSLNKTFMFCLTFLWGVFPGSRVIFLVPGFFLILQLCFSILDYYSCLFVSFRLLSALRSDLLRLLIVCPRLVARLLKSVIT